MVTIKSTNKRHEFWITEGDYTAVKRELFRKLDGAGSFYFGAQKPIVLFGKRFSEEQKQDMRDMLRSDFNIKNVLFSDEISDETPREESDSEGHTQCINAYSFESLFPPTKTVFLTETVRNGRRVVSEADIVVAGDVNAGAELIAAGSIAVVGKLRGLAHAGAQGDKSACIAASQLLSNQIRIAGKVAIMPERKKTDGPELARYIGDNIVISSI